MIVDNIDNIKYDTYAEKARAILYDDNMNIYIMEINESMQLPGGGVEKFENYHETIIRELDEEIGLTVDSIDELGTLNFYHENFPCLKNNYVCDRRVNKVHFFYKNITGIELHETKRTPFEIENNMMLKIIPQDELLTLLDKPSKNDYKKFMAIEVRAALDLFNKKIK